MKRSHAFVLASSLVWFGFLGCGGDDGGSGGDAGSAGSAGGAGMGGTGGTGAAGTAGSGPNCEDGCLIDSECYDDGEANPGNACEACDVTVSSSTWSDNDGAACDDGVHCNGADSCSEGTCSVHAGDPCPDDGLFCTGNESCDEDADACVSSGNPCTGDDQCMEDRDLCCLPGVAATAPACDANGDVTATDTCGDVVLVEDCPDVNGVCVEGACGCAGNYAGAACDQCAPGWTGDDCDRCVVYVDGSLPDYTGHQGRSWDRALESVQPAIDAAVPFGCEVWVAQGVYVPGAQREATFQLASGVALRGGFAGGESSIEQRDIAAHETVLSGDLNGDDGADFTNVADNVYHVVKGADDTVLDGFTITGGYAADKPVDKFGGGMYNQAGSVSVLNCTFRGNAAFEGGGMYNDGNAFDVTNCVFESNRASIGGGIRSNSASGTLTRCTFKDNSDGVGAAISTVASDLAVTSCTFQGNAGFLGGAMANSESTVTVTNSTFVANSASHRGGAMRNASTSPDITNCIFWGNTAPEGPVIFNDTSVSSITYSNVQNGCAAIAGASCGEGNLNADPVFVDGPGGDLRLSAVSPCVDQGNDQAAPYTDKDGNRRRDVIGVANGLGGYSDMGAYEYQSAPACGDHVRDPGEACDDGNADDADGCPSTCACPLSTEGQSCADILAADASAPDGVHVISPDETICPFEVYCDMTTDGGGWTLVAKVHLNDYRVATSDPGAGGAPDAMKMNSNWRTVERRLDRMLDTDVSYDSELQSNFRLDRFVSLFGGKETAIRWEFIASSNSASRTVFAFTPSVEVLLGWQFNTPQFDVCADVAKTTCVAGSWSGPVVADGNHPNDDPTFFGGVEPLLDDVGSPHFRYGYEHGWSMCSATGDDAGNVWPDNGNDGHWGNGSRTWVR